MRIKLTFKQLKPRQLIPSDYQYAITSFIYRTLERSDPEYSQWLHSNGFTDSSKKFKFFNFSDFFVPERSFKVPGKMEIISNEFYLNVSMLSNKGMENLITGMFNEGRMRIFDSTTEADFDVKYIEMVPEPDFKEVMRYRLKTPAVFSKKVIYNGKESAHFFIPSENEFVFYFLKNISEKYKVLNARTNGLHDIDCDMKIISQFKKHLRCFQPKGSAVQKIIGYKYDFELKAPPDVQRMIWMSGVGAKNSLGFGFVEELKKNVK